MWRSDFPSETKLLPLFYLEKKIFASIISSECEKINPELGLCDLKAHDTLTEEVGLKTIFTKVSFLYKAV